MKKHFLTTLLFLVGFSTLVAQDFSVDANFRTRSEYRHGQGRLFQKEEKPAFFVNQRARLGTSYQNEWLELRLTAQQIFTWGDAQQPQAELKNHLGFFEAWAKMQIDENWNVKLGRQVISYDDERILGGLDWSQYGRFHDAAVVSYKNFLNVGLAFNQEGQPNVGNAYAIGNTSKNTYKTMQFLRANKKWQDNSLSFLFINNGFQDFDSSGKQDGVSNMQTTGFYGIFPISSLMLEASAYYQFGKFQKTSVSAYQLRAELIYKTQEFTAGLGMEMLSGRDYDDTSAKIKSFNPLYGTAHKFNGHMDFYYLGQNLQGTTGLNDIYAKAIVKFNEKSNLLFMPHIFMSNAKRADSKSYLGTELDFMFTQQFRKDVALNVGYSHHLPSDAIKVATTHGMQNWFWVQLNIKPTLFTTKQ
ncbi:alginate export family protein [Capnocytophaga canis]|uniref:alginate export family protein n=1 Tax=Capnocytophaga canis TaxID=1848903 RepID=UPI0037D65070